MAWHNSKYKKLGDSYSDYLPEYKVWGAMIRRCTNPSCDMYAFYGGRGIRVCDRWLDKKDGFINFYSDMGKRPVSDDGRVYQIDRIDNDWDYCPENCRWAPPSVNARNRSDNVFIVIYGDKYCAADACKMFNVKRTTVTEAIRLGRKTPTDAFADALERSK